VSLVAATPGAMLRDAIILVISRFAPIARACGNRTGNRTAMPSALGHEDMTYRYI